MKQRISPEKAHVRARVAGLKRAIRNGERTADCPELRGLEQQLAVLGVSDQADALAAKARQLVADWPDLTDEQLGRIAGVLKASGAAG